MLDRRSFLLSALALTAVSACGTDAPSTSTAAAGGARGPGYPRTVRHEQGRTRIEAPPRRIVCATDGGELCSLLALGVRPVGFGRRNDPLRSWVRDLAEGIDSYDLAADETDYERLAAWRPDLLLVQDGFATPETMPRLSGLAPTVATSFIDWRANLRQVGEAVGREQRAGELEAEADAAVAEAATRLRGRAEGFRVRLLTAFADGSVYVLNDRSPVGKIATALGLADLPAQESAGEAVNPVSLERLDSVDGDLLVLLHFETGPGEDATDGLRDEPVFAGLDAARAGRVVDLSEDESQQTYFDSVLTVERNARLLERLVTEATR